jgi:thiamine kinase-like enzyme
LTCFLSKDVDLVADFARLRAALATSLPQLPLVFSHNDLLIYNILHDAGTGPICYFF